MSEDTFSWSQNDSIAVPSMDAIAVYKNKDGDIVIRQQGRMHMDEDSVIILPNNRLGELIIALNNEIEDPQFVDPQP